MRLDPLVMDRWEPALLDRHAERANRDLAEGRFPGRRPPIGALITTRDWRKPMRVVHIDEVDEVLWSEPERRHVHGLKPAYQREHAPFRIIVVPDGVDVEDKDAWQPYGIDARMRSDWYFVLPEHYAVCRHCGDLAPCLELTSQRKAVAAMERQAEIDGKLMAGCCPACGEPVTRRQQAVTFPGPNLLSPLAHDSPAFHLRRQCLHNAKRYEERWVAADPSRQPSMLTAKCPGTLVTHQDGDQECTRPTECPGLPAHHACLSSCPGMGKGGLREAGVALGFRVDEPACDRGCTGAGHPGARGRAWSEFGEHGQPVA